MSVSGADPQTCREQSPRRKTRRNLQAPLWRQLKSHSKWRDRTLGDRPSSSDVLQCACAPGGRRGAAEGRESRSSCCVCVCVNRYTPLLTRATTRHQPSAVTPPSCKPRPRRRKHPPSAHLFRRLPTNARIVSARILCKLFHRLIDAETKFTPNIHVQKMHLRHRDCDLRCCTRRRARLKSVTESPHGVTLTHCDHHRHPTTRGTYPIVKDGIKKPHGLTCAARSRCSRWHSARRRAMVCCHRHTSRLAIAQYAPGRVRMPLWFAQRRRGLIPCFSWTTLVWK